MVEGRRKGQEDPASSSGSTCQVSSASVSPLDLSFLICKDMGQDHMP